MADDFLSGRLGCWMSLGVWWVCCVQDWPPWDILSWCYFAILYSVSEPALSLGSDSLGQMIPSCQSQEEKNKV